VFKTCLNLNTKKLKIVVDNLKYARYIINMMKQTTKESEMKVSIRNNFHNSCKNVRLNEGRNEIRGRRLREWKRSLCCSNCVCSGVGGLRGDADNPSVVDADGNAIEWGTEYDNMTGEEYLIIWA